MKYILLSVSILFFNILLFAQSAIDQITPDDILEIRSSNSDNGSLAFDYNRTTRWESAHKTDPSWLDITFKEIKKINSLKIYWETASAKEYRLQISDNKNAWKDIAVIKDGQTGEARLISFPVVQTKYLRLYCDKRTTDWGYSIWEIVFNPVDTARQNYPYLNKNLSIEKRVEDLLSRLTLDEKLSMLTGESWMDTAIIDRLAIPAIKFTDGPHGVGSRGASTCFPTGVSLGSTWDPDLIYRLGKALAEETRALNRNILLGPCINIHRTPLGGRNFESYSEDPYLVSRLAVAYIKSIQEEKIGTSVKHYACNNQEWERFTISTEIDERTLQEIYLPAFRAAVVEADVWTVMAAYNKINGDYACANKHLLTDLLKNEWKLNGFVVSDWEAVKSTVASVNAGCDLEMPGPGKYFKKDLLKQALQNKEITVETINDKVRRILRVIYYLGLFDPDKKLDPGSVNTAEHQNLAREIAQNSIILLKNDKKLLPLDRSKIKSIAVIGPNAGVSRLGGGGSSTVVPPYSVSPLQGLQNKLRNSIEIKYIEGCSIDGPMQEIDPALFQPSLSEKNRKGFIAEYYNNTELKGEPVVTRIEEKVYYNWENEPPVQGVPNDNYSVRWTGYFTPKISGEYELIIASDDGSRLYVDDTLLVDGWYDHAIEVKSGKIKFQAGRKYRICLEFFEKSGGAVMKFGWILPGDYYQEIKKIAAGADVAIVCAGLSWLHEGEGYDKKDMSLPDPQDELIKVVNQANPNTVVVLINGTPLDMRKWVDQVHTLIEAWYPGMEGGNAIADILFGDVNPSGKLPCTFPVKYEDTPCFGNYPGTDGKVFYKEGIYVGYRFYDKNNVKTQFPFGYGLSYTEFKYSNLKSAVMKDKKGVQVTVTLDVENTGQRKGKEVVQLYIHDPVSKIDRPVQELKAFRKVELNPGEKKKVSFLLKEDAFSYFDPDKMKWIMEPGDFEIRINSSSRDIRLKEMIKL